MRLDLRRHRAFARETARVTSGRLVFEVPTDAMAFDVAVDKHGRREHRIRIGRAAKYDAVLRFDPAHFRDCHSAREPRASQVLTGGDAFDLATAVRFDAVRHERAHEDDALALLAGD